MSSHISQRLAVFPSSTHDPRVPSDRRRRRRQRRGGRQDGIPRRGGVEPLGGQGQGHGGLWGRGIPGGRVCWAQGLNPGQVGGLGPCVRAGGQRGCCAAWSPGCALNRRGCSQGGRAFCAVQTDPSTPRCPGASGDAVHRASRGGQRTDHPGAGTELDGHADADADERVSGRARAGEQAPPAKNTAWLSCFRVGLLGTCWRRCPRVYA